jgi:N-acyl-phosphatidylethanolamine-hydrolysing phospholipase D
VIGPEHRVFYPGDTAFIGDEFAKVGKKLGPFDLALIPIGCYRPAAVMSHKHMGPTEAVRVHQLVRAKVLYFTGNRGGGLF